MKYWIVLFTLLASSVAQAAPEAAVSQTIKEMLTILKSGNDRTRVTGLCELVRRRVDNATIGSELLGGYYGKLGRDATGIAAFKTLVPSIIMDQFYELLQGKGGSPFSVNGTVAKGSGRIGVRVKIGDANFTVTVLKASEKVVDVEFAGYSLVKVKRNEFQGDLQGYNSANPKTSLPVSEVVKDLKRKGVTKCN